MSNYSWRTHKNVSLEHDIQRFTGLGVGRVFRVCDWDAGSMQLDTWVVVVADYFGIMWHLSLDRRTSEPIQTRIHH